MYETLLLIHTTPAPIIRRKLHISNISQDLLSDWPENLEPISHRSSQYSTNIFTIIFIFVFHTFTLFCAKHSWKETTFAEWSFHFSFQSQDLSFPQILPNIESWYHSRLPLTDSLTCFRFPLLVSFLSLVLVFAIF